MSKDESASSHAQIEAMRLTMLIAVASGVVAVIFFLTLGLVAVHQPVPPAPLITMPPPSCDKLLGEMQCGELQNCSWRAGVCVDSLAIPLGAAPATSAADSPKASPHKGKETAPGPSVGDSSKAASSTRQKKPAGERARTLMACALSLSWIARRPSNACC